MGRTDRAGLLVHADPAAVFAALTSRDALFEWLPPKGMRGRFEHFDLREGGSFRFVLTYEDAAGSPGKTSDDSDVSKVRIAQLVPPTRIVWEVDFESDDPSFQGTMRMEWMLREVDEGTDLSIVASDVPEGIRAADHAAGLTSSLANLAAYLEPGVGERGGVGVRAGMGATP